MRKFKITINGRTKELIHNSRHKANSRSVALIKHLEYLRKENKSDNQEVVNAFKVGYNTGYDEAKKRTNENWRNK